MTGFGAVPVEGVAEMVIVYPTVLVSPMVVTVAEALALGVTVDGLTVQTGGSTTVVTVDVTTQARSTVPLKPLIAPTVMVDDEVPPGATASGLNGAACRVTPWADASDGRARQAASRHRVAMPVCRMRWVRGDFDESGFGELRLDELKLEELIVDELDNGVCDRDDSDFNMSKVCFGVCFKTASFPLASIHGAS
jgi:hypothetical protein